MDIFDAMAAGQVPSPPPSQPPHSSSTAERLAKAELALSYDLAKRVPDMERGFSISTSYGEIYIGGGTDADSIADAVRSVLERRLAVTTIARVRAERSSHARVTVARAPA